MCTGGHDIQELPCPLCHQPQYFLLPPSSSFWSLPAPTPCNPGLDDELCPIPNTCDQWAFVGCSLCLECLPLGILSTSSSEKPHQVSPLPHSHRPQGCHWVGRPPGQPATFHLSPYPRSKCNLWVSIRRAAPLWLWSTQIWGLNLAQLYDLGQITEPLWASGFS